MPSSYFHHPILHPRWILSASVRCRFLRKPSQWAQWTFCQDRSKGLGPWRRNVDNALFGQDGAYMSTDAPQEIVERFHQWSYSVRFFQQAMDTNAELRWSFLIAPLLYLLFCPGVPGLAWSPFWTACQWHERRWPFCFHDKQNRLCDDYTLSFAPGTPSWTLCNMYRWNGMYRQTFPLIPGGLRISHANRLWLALHSPPVLPRLDSWFLRMAKSRIGYSQPFEKDTPCGLCHSIRYSCLLDPIDMPRHKNWLLQQSIRPRQQSISTDFQP